MTRNELTPRPNPLAAVMLETALNEKDDGEEWLIEDVLARGSLAVVYGKSHVGKTRLLVHQMLSLSRGRQTFGRWDPERRRRWVLYWPSEGTRMGFKRLAGQTMYRTASPWDGEEFRAKYAHTVTQAARDAGLLEPAAAVFFTIPPVGLPVPSFKSPEFRDVCASSGADVIVLDTYGRFPGCGDENLASEFRENVVIPLKSIADSYGGKTFILVHHPGKNGEGPRGSSAIPADFDTILRVDRLRDVNDGQSIVDGTRHRLKVTIEKVRDAPPRDPLDAQGHEFQIYRTNLDGSFQIVPGESASEGGGTGGHSLDTRILGALAGADAPMNTGAVANAVHAKPEDVSARLRVLQEQGLVKMTSAPPSKLWSLVR